MKIEIKKIKKIRYEMKMKMFHEKNNWKELRKETVWTRCYVTIKMM